MFGGKMGVHIIQFPSKRFGYVGSVPAALGHEVTATKADVMGCRSHRNAAGELVTWKFPTFDTEAEARVFAKSKSVELSN